VRIGNSDPAVALTRHPSEVDAAKRLLLADYRWSPTGASRGRLRLCFKRPLLGPRSHYFPNPLVGQTVKA